MNIRAIVRVLTLALPLTALGGIVLALLLLAPAPPPPPVASQGGAVQVGFLATEYSGTEGSEVTVVVEVKGDDGPPNPVDLRITGEGVEVDATFAAHALDIVVPITLPEDEIANVTPDDVVLTLTVTGGSATVAAGFGTATLRIEDDDPLARVAFGTNDRTRFTGTGTLVELDVELQSGVTATRAIDLLVQGVPVPGTTSTTETRLITIETGTASALLAFIAPDNDRADLMHVPLNLALEVGGDGDEAVVDPSGAEAMVAVIHDRRILLPDRTQVNGDLTQAGQVHFWLLKNVPEDALLVVQSVDGVGEEGRLRALDGTELKGFSGSVLNQMTSFRITHRATGGPADLILEVRGGGNVTGTYGLFAELADVVGTVEYNRPEGARMDLETGTLPRTHYYRVMVPAEAAGREVAVIVDTSHGMDTPRMELLNADGTVIEGRFLLDARRIEIRQMLAPGEYLLAVNGWIDDDTGNLNQEPLRDYVVTLRGPEAVGFAADDLSRAVPEDETFTLTVAVAVTARTDLTLNVGYSGGGGYTGPATVTIPRGASSAELPLRVPSDMVKGTSPPPLRVTLSDPSPGFRLQPSSVMATVTLMDNDPIALAGFVRANYAFTEGERVTVPLELKPGEDLDVEPLTVMVTGVPGRTEPLVLEFTNTERSRDITFDVPDDDLAATPPEIVLAIVNNLPPAQARVAPGLGVATLRIWDDDPVARVGFRRFDRVRVVGEGELVEVRVELQEGVTATRAIDVLVRGVPVAGTTSTTGTRLLTIETGTAFGSLLFIAPGPDGRVHAPPIVADMMLTLSVAGVGNGDEAVLDLSDHGLAVSARIQVIPADSTLPLGRHEVILEVTRVGQIPHVFFLPSVPDGALLVVQSFSSDRVRTAGTLFVGGRVLVADVDRFVNQGRAFRITRRVDGPSIFRLETRGLDASGTIPSEPTGTYGLFAEVGNVVGTVEYNRPEGPPRTIPASRLPMTHFHRLIVPEAAAGQTVTVRAASAEDKLVVELLNADGAPIADGVVSEPGNVQEIRRMLEPGEYFLAVNRRNSFLKYNQFPAELRDYVVTLRGPAAAGFAAQDLSRTVPENEPFTLNVGLAPGTIPAAQDVTLNVGYSGGGGYTGPATVTLPAGATSVGLPLRVPGDTVVGTVPDPLRVTLSDPSAGSVLRPGFVTANVTLTENDPVARVGFRMSDRARSVSERVLAEVAVELQDGVTATRAIDLLVRGINPDDPSETREITILRGANSASLTFTAPGDAEFGMVPDPLNLTLEVAGNGDEAVVDPSGARAMITILDRLELEDLLTDADPVHRVQLPNVPGGKLLVVQSYRGQDVKARLFAADGVTVLKENDDFINQVSFRITHRVTVGPADFILEVERGTGFIPGRNYGLLAEVVDGVVGTVEYNRPAGPPMTIPASAADRLPLAPHYYRLIVPAAAAGQEVTVRAASGSGDGLRVELLDETGTHITVVGERFQFGTERVVTRPLAPGEYLLAVSGGNSQLAGNLGHAELRDYVVTLRGPEIVEGFVAGDLSRTVPENETFTLTVALAPGVGTALQDVTLDVGYAGGNGYTGDPTVTIPAGANSTELTLRVPGDRVVGTTPTALRVHLSNPSAGSVLRPDFVTATVALTDNDPPALVGFDAANYVFTEGETVTVRLELKPGSVLAETLTVMVTGVPRRTEPLALTFPPFFTGSADVTFTAPDDDDARVVPDDVVLTIVDNLPPDRAELASGLGVATVRFRDDGDALARVGFAATAIDATEGEPVTLAVGLQTDVTATRAIDLLVRGVPVVGTSTTETRLITIGTGTSFTLLRITAPDNDVVGVVPAPLNLTLEVAGNGDEAVIDPSGARAVITTADREILPLDRSEVTGNLTDALQIHRWHLENVPADALLVVQSFNNVDVVGWLLDADSNLLKSVNDFLNQIAFRITHRITHRVTGGSTDLVLEVSARVNSPGGVYGLFAEVVNVVGTVEYNRPAGPPMTLDAGRLPLAHYYRVVVPPEAAGRALTLSVVNGNDDGMRVELMDAAGTVIESRGTSDSTHEIRRTLAQGDYLLAVNGHISDSGGNLNQEQVRDYVVTLRDSEFVGFAADDLSRTVPENETFTLTVGVAPGLGTALRDVTLNVAYSGGGGYTGPTTVTLPAGATSVGLPLRVPGDTVVGTVPDPLRVTLSDPSAGSVLRPGFVTANVTLTENDPPALVGFGAASYVFTEGETVTVKLELKPGSELAEPLTVMVTGVPDRAEPLALTFPPFTGSADVTFTAPDDPYAAPPDDVVLAIVDNLPPDRAKLASGLGVATVRFTNDDPLARVAFKESDRARTVEEGASVEVTVELQDGVPATRAIDLLVHGVPVAGTSTTETRLITIRTGTSLTLLTFTAPVNGVAGMVPAALNLVLEVAGKGDEAALDPNGARATFTMTDREETLPPDGSEVTGVLAAGQVHRWHLTAVPDDTLLVVQSVSDNNVDVQGRLLAADGVTELKANDNFLNLNAFRITHRVTVGPANFILEVRGSNNNVTGTYGLFAEDANVVGTVEYNRPETPARTIPMSRLPQTHYYRVVVPREAAGRDVTLRAANDMDGLRVELLEADGTFIVNEITGFNTMREITRILDPGEYLFAVNGGGPGNSGNLNQRVLSNYVVTLRGPQFVGFAADDLSRTVAENETFTLTVALTPGLGTALRDVTLNVAYSGGGGYTGPATVTIPAGATSTELPLRVPGDTMADAAPAPLTVTLSDPPPGSVRPAPAVATVTIVDDGDPVASLGFADVTTRTVAEGEAVTLRVILRGGVKATRAVSVVAAFSDGRDAETVTIDSGASSAMLEVAAPDDDVVGGMPPVLTITLGTPTNATLTAGAAQVAVSVTDDDVALVGFAASRYTGIEGEQVTVTVTLSAVTTKDVVVEIRASGVRNRTLTIPAGSIAADLAFTAPDDTTAGEMPRRQQWFLLSAENAELDPDRDMTLIAFRDDDKVLVGFAAASLMVTAVEDEKVTLTLELKDEITSSDPVDIRVRFGGGMDGEQTVTLSKDVRDELSVEFSFGAPGDEIGNVAPMAVTLTLIPAPDIRLASGFTRAVITVLDVDLASVGFAARDAARTVEEGAAVELRLELLNGAVATRAVSVLVNYSDGSDPQTATIETGSSFTLLAVNAPDDSAVGQTPAALTLTLSTPTNAVLTSAGRIATIRVTDEDTASPSPSIPPPPPMPPPPRRSGGGSSGGGGPMLMLTVLPVVPAEIREGNRIIYTITRVDTTMDINVMVRVTAGTGGANPNELSFAETVAMPAGAASVEHVITALLDARQEGAERFAVTFTPVDARGTALGPPQRRDLTVTNLEPFVLQVEGTALSEGDVLEVRVTRPAGTPANREFTLGVTAVRVEPRGAAADDLIFPDSVTLEPGMRFVDFRVQVVRDELEEPPERFELTVAGADTLNITVANRPYLPGAGGVEPAWWQLAALAALALALGVAGALLLARRRQD